MSFGEKLKEARERKKYTQQQVAEMVGVKKNTISGYEKGNREPDVAMVKKLIQVLGVTSSELFELPQFDDSNDVPGIYSERALQLAALYDSLYDEGKEIIDKSAEIAERHFVQTRKLTRRIPLLGTAYLDGRVETKYAARQEYQELEAAEALQQSEPEVALPEESPVE